MACGYTIEGWKVDEQFSAVKRADEAWLAHTTAATGFVPLNAVWAKLEIVFGLAAAAGGVKMLAADGLTGLAGGALIVLGAYLAPAGNRSHLYQSQNLQTAFLLQSIMSRMNGDAVSPGEVVHG